MTSLIALLIATPVAIAIGLYLSELAPRGVRGIVGALVETLAALPSVVVGLWGLLVLAPFLHTGSSFLTASLVLAIMVVPITASVCRELFLAVPTDLEEAALGLGATRWEMVRGVILPYARSGVAAGVMLGLGRALGEAIAVTQVIGGFGRTSWHLLLPGDTLASRIASQYAGAATKLQIASLVYLAGILLVIALVVNLAAQLIVRRFEFVRTGGG